jgi:hypothetical protein
MTFAIMNYLLLSIIVQFKTFMLEVILLMLKSDIMLIVILLNVVSRGNTYSNFNRELPLANYLQGLSSGYSVLH